MRGRAMRRIHSRRSRVRSHRPTDPFAGNGVGTARLHHAVEKTWDIRKARIRSAKGLRQHLEALHEPAD